MQKGILADVPRVGRHLVFRLEHGVSPSDALSRLARVADGEEVILGVGAVTAAALGANVEGLRDSPLLEGAKVVTPSTPAALWLFIRGDDRGEVLLTGQRLAELAAPAFVVEEIIDVFRHGSGRDLSGYEDGTENPTDEKAVAAAFSASGAEGITGASYVGVQRWVHDLARFRSFEPRRRDDIIGRRIEDNVEFDEAPASAHVKRAAQESFDPEAFMVRRSMPFSDDEGDGLVFVAFGKSLDAFEAIMRRMVGLEDGIVDALYDFTRPVSSRFFFCPPMRDGKLDLRALGL
jgi:porphyrinogen peroxidase